MTYEEIAEQIKTLSAEERSWLADLLDTLQKQTVKGNIQERILGLGQTLGQFRISPDFDDPIFPDNWMDDPSDLLNWPVSSQKDSE